jgi:hypothetical protein
MARLVLKRGADTAAMFSRIEVSLDGVRCASLLPLQRKEVELEAGSHQLVANISWAQSRTLELSAEENDIVTLRVKAPWSAFRQALKSTDDVRNAGISDAVVIERVD